MKNIILALFAMTAISLAGVPKPDRYITDNSHLISDDRAKAINEKLAQFERDTSNQVIIYITPALPDDIDTYTTELMHEWGVGQKGKSNGVGLFIFSDAHKAAIRTGYGLEGALPDAVCTSIRKNTLSPLWKQQKYADALDATADRIIQTVKGEYKGDGKTVSDKYSDTAIIILFVVIGVIILIVIIAAKSDSSSYFGGGYSGGSSSSSSGSSWGGGDCGGGGSSGDC